MFDFEHQLKILPDSPGVYIMKDKRGEIIYIGKAKVLKKRVRQYFRNPNRLDTKTRVMSQSLIILLPTQKSSL